MANLEELAATITTALPGAVTGHSIAFGELTVTAPGKAVRMLWPRLSSVGSMLSA